MTSLAQYAFEVGLSAIAKIAKRSTGFAALVALMRHYRNSFGSSKPKRRNAVSKCV